MPHNVSLMNVPKLTKYCPCASIMKPSSAVCSELKLSAAHGIELVSVSRDEDYNSACSFALAAHVLLFKEHLQVL